MFTADVDDTLGSLHGLGATPKWIKKLTSSKAVRKVGAGYAGAITLGIIKPKVFHIYNKSSKKVYRVAGNVGKVAAVVAGGVLLAPIVGPAAGSMLGVVKGFFTSKGAPPDTAQAMAEGVVAGQIPAPPELAAQLKSQYGVKEAGMFSSGAGLILPVGLVGVGVLAYMKYGRKRK